LTSEFLHLCEQQPFNWEPKEALHKNSVAVADVRKKNLKGQYKVFSERVEKKNESQQHFPHF
jgi:hypothetical protein